MYAGQGCNYFFAVKGNASPPVVFDMFYFFGILKEGLTAFSECQKSGKTPLF